MSKNVPAISVAPVPAVFLFENHEIRIINEDDEVWFNALDICEALTFKNPRDAVNRHVDNDDVVKRDAVDSAGRSQSCNYVNLSGMNALTLGSTKPEAKRFKRWVTKDILPSIYKTGSYTHPAAPVQTLPAISTDPLDLFLITSNAIQQIKAETDARIMQVEDMTLTTATKFDDFMSTRPLLPHQCHGLQKAVAEKVTALCDKYKIYNRLLFSSLYGFLKRHFNVNTYSAIPSTRFDEAMAVVRNLVIEQLPEGIRQKAGAK